MLSIPGIPKGIRGLHTGLTGFPTWKREQQSRSSPRGIPVGTLKEASSRGECSLKKKAMDVSWINIRTFHNPLKTAKRVSPNFVNVCGISTNSFKTRMASSNACIKNQRRTRPSGYTSFFIFLICVSEVVDKG